MKRIAFLIFISLLHTTLSAQQGTISGLVKDAVSAETLIGVNVSIKGTTIGTFTDLDGKFSLSIAPGTYDLQVSYVSYQSSTITGVQVKDGEVAVLNEIRLSAAYLELGEVIVKAELVKNNESAMLVMKQRSASMLDGISSEKMALIGDGNAAEAAKRVTGISIEGGKYVYVRGLGDRYSKTTLNGMEIPGLDPDRNSLQLDIFPSNLINNIMVSKNFTSDMPGDFSGGLMNIETKDFPETRYLSISGGLGFNPSMHLNSDYLSSEGSSTDFLGFDNGLRELPTSAAGAIIPTPTSGAPVERVSNFVKQFNPNLAASRESSLFDYDFSINYGNHVDLAKGSNGRHRKLGYMTSLSYRTDYIYYDDVQYGEYQRYSEAETTEMRYATKQVGELGEKSVLLGAIAGLAYKSDLSKVKLTLIRLQSGTNRAGKFSIDNNGEAIGQSGYIATSDNLEYNQRSLTNLFIGGSHLQEKEKWEFEWNISPTLSLSDDPDIRKTAFTITPNNIFFSAGAGGNPSRIWRSLREFNLASRADMTVNYLLKQRTGKFKFGASNTYKSRDYEILFFDIQFFGPQSWNNTDADQVLLSQNLFPNQPNSIYYQSGNNRPNPNEYSSEVYNTGFYISNEMPLSKRLNSIVGLRAERFVQTHTGRDQAYASGDVVNGNNLVDKEVLNSLNLLPSINLIYALDDKQNLRLAYANTIARPSFKELSFAQIIDPITNRIFNGGLFVYRDSEGNVTWDGKLKETDIVNLDLRWEVFKELGQMYSISAFYKEFTNPIELIRIPEQQASTELQPRNVGDGTVYGIEFELRKNLSFIGEKLESVTLNTNLTIAESNISMTEIEFLSRKAFERIGENIDNNRQMAGQAPYVINFGVTYSSPENNVDIGIFYNVKGPTLEVVGIGLSPDVYTQPFNSLNLSINKELGKENKSAIDIKVANILGDRTESYYQSYGATDQIFTSFNPGRTFSIGFSHSF